MTDTNGLIVQNVEELLPGKQPLEGIELAHTGGTTYVALDTRDARLTAYTVDLNKPTCTCAYFQDETEAERVCPHMAVALMDHPDRMDVETETVSHLFRQVHDLNQSVSALQSVAAELDGGMTKREPREADQTEPQTAEGQGQGSEPAMEPEPTVDPLSAVDAWLEENFGQPQKVQTERGDHGSTEGVRLYPNNQEMADSVYESFKSLVNAVDGSTVHVGFTSEGCQTCNSGDSGFWYHIPTPAARGLD